MRSFTETQFLSMISDSFVFNKSKIDKEKYIEFLLALFSSAKEEIQKDPTDYFFVLLIPIETYCAQADLETFGINQYKTFIHNNSRGYSNDLQLTHVLNDQNTFIKVIDEIDNTRAFEFL